MICKYVLTLNFNFIQKLDYGEFILLKKMNHLASLVWNKIKVQGLTHICLKAKTKVIAY